MAGARRVMRPVIVLVPPEERFAGTYEIHLGNAGGLARAYRRVGTDASRGGGQLVRLKDADKRLPTVLKYFKLGIAQQKAAERLTLKRTAEAKAVQERRFAYRFGKLVKRVWVTILRGLARMGFLEVEEGGDPTRALWRWAFWRVVKARRARKTEITVDT